MKKSRFIPFILIMTVMILAFSFQINGEVINLSNTSQGNPEIKAKVLKVDNSNVMQAGMTKVGNQYLKIKIKEGKYRGKTVRASNALKGKLQIDNQFKVGDTVIATVIESNNKITAAKVIDLWRLPWELCVFGIFIFLLILYAGYTGIKALFSFVTSLYVIWYILIPGLLEGQQPLILSAGVLILLSAIIIFSVAGLNKKGLAAFISTISGLFMTIGIPLFVGDKLALKGMTAPFAQTLVFSGHTNLNMKFILYAAIIIGASGAAMDIAMDVAASMAEVKHKKPEINRKELIQSGFNVGKAVIGTMTTTLLLAYSGGYLTMLMAFATKHSSFRRMINFKMVSAEILRTLTGSIGLVLVAPITAIVADWIYSLEKTELFEIELIQTFKNKMAKLLSLN
ncbi:YibE/F family protein [Sporohalobacter salinus]|uniref:YibE/F family protein n=1 Tax=Sporohalobacter salinus TaxID=1494606 RepID=UPI001EF985E8|nr:YibE/F family protein [Sporohalobacter salinus]MBM7622477.1 putative membrane protein [Sporohalobacter salinus]